MVFYKRALTMLYWPIVNKVSNTIIVTCVAHVANVGWNTFEYRTDFLYISDWLGIKETTRTSNLLELHDMAKEHKDLVTPCTLSTCTIHPTFVTSWVLCNSSVVRSSFSGRHCGLIVSMLDSGFSWLGSILGLRQEVIMIVFLSKTL